jgi:hypothetical protein
VPSWYMCSGTDERSSSVALEHPNQNSFSFVCCPRFFTSAQFSNPSSAAQNKMSSRAEVLVPEFHLTFSHLSLHSNRQTNSPFQRKLKVIRSAFQLSLSFGLPAAPLRGNAHVVWLSGRRCSYSVVLSGTLQTPVEQPRTSRHQDVSTWYRYCDMTPKSRSSGVGARLPLPGNGSVNTA